MPKITVFHRKFDGVTPFSAFPSAEDVSKAYSNDEFEKVAEIKDAGLDDAFRLTNHIEDSWVKNDGVTSFNPRPRSTSVGDIIHVADDGFYMVAGIGFEALDSLPSLA